MTREILFRGKCLYNGEWVEGNLFIPDKVTRLDVPTEILVGTNAIRRSYAVDPSTVGQYTGLCDKNGKTIFEGDILPIWENGEEYNYKVIYNADCFMLAMLDSAQGSYPLSIKHNQTEVIGNIHDNPELLEGEK